MTTTAYSYLRMSTETQLKGDSLRRQLEASQKYAEKHGFHLAESLQDIGVSAFRGKNAKEGALATFLDAIKQGYIKEGSVLLVESLDRISRDEVLDAFELFLGILKAGITIVTLADEQTYTKASLTGNMGQLFTSLGIMFRANEESAIKSKRLKASWSNKRANLGTKKYTSISPAWLNLNKETNEFEVIPEAARAVQRIFDLCIGTEEKGGRGTYAITKDMNLNIDEYPPISRSDKWGKSYVTKILHNPAVYGLFRPHKMVDGKREETDVKIENYFPVIVPKDRFDLAQKRLAKRQKGGNGGGRKGATFNNIFTKLAKCGNCGETMTFRDRGRPPKGGKYLRCYNAESHHECKCPAWNYDDFEQSFFKFIREIDLAEVFKRGNDEAMKRKLRDQRSVIQKNIEDHETSYKTLTKRMANPKTPESIVDDLYEEMDRIKKEIETLDQRDEELRQELAEIESRNAEKSKQELIDTFNQMNATLEDEEKKELRLKVHHHISEVVDTITVKNCETLFTPWDAEEEISTKLRKELAEQGYTTTEQLEEFFSSKYGKRLFNESQRYFIVKFKNGTSRSVHPHRGGSYMPLTNRLVTFYKNTRKRKDEQARKARRKNSASNPDDT